VTWAHDGFGQLCAEPAYAATRDAADAGVAALQRMATSVRHDVHRMHAFLRCREVPGSDGPRYVVWYEPEHRILERAAP